MIEHPKQYDNVWIHRIHPINGIEHWSTYLERWEKCGFSSLAFIDNRNLVSYDDTWCEPFMGMEDDLHL